METDTFDVLGIPSSKLKFGNLEKACKDVCNLLSGVKGKRLQPYPPYSSIRVDGHPLFWWARNGRIKEIAIPCIEVEVKLVHIIFWLCLMFEKKGFFL